MKSITRKKAIICLYAYIIILLTPKIKANDNPQISFISDYTYNSTIPYASYSNGYVYIAEESEILKILNPDDNNVYIKDSRCDSDPDILIYNSYKITSDKQRNEIIKIILEYENQFPSSWNRTDNSLDIEWRMHNLGFILGFDKTRTSHVDLNNADEEIYDLDVLSRILGN